MTAAVVAIVDYAAGNTFSMRTALERVGADPYVCGDAAGLRPDTSHLVLPGVGAFGHCLSRLRDAGLEDVVLAWAVAERPLLGVCVGFQILCHESEESRGVAGLGLVPATVSRLSDRGWRVPHVGWNTLRAGGPQADHLRGFAYFNHSFGIRSEEAFAEILWSDFGGGFVAEARTGSLLMAQYHPEKSQSFGERLLRRFVKDPSEW